MKKTMPTRVAGFSLIELMISIAIGLVMVVFVTSLYARSKGSYDTNDENSRLQQEVRLVMALLGRNLTQAGYGVPIGIVGGNLQTNFVGQALRACDNGFSTPNDTSVTGCGATGKPGFEVSYVTDATVNTNTGAGTDCNGQTAPVNATTGARIVINRFYLATPAGESTPSLYCAGNGNPTGQPLLSNVEDLRLTYGVVSNANKQPDSFVNTVAAVAVAEAAAVPAVTVPFGGVVSVGICMQVASPDTVGNTAQAYRDCNGVTQMATDRKIHLVVNGTFTLRNNSDTTLIPYPNNP